MRQADVDGNGTLDYGEFVAVSIHLKKIGNDDHLRQAFSYFDQNNTGYIEIEELRESLADDLGLNYEEVIKSIIRDVDTDKVSCNGSSSLYIAFVARNSFHPVAHISLATVSFDLGSRERERQREIRINLSSLFGKSEPVKHKSPLCSFRAHLAEIGSSAVSLSEMGVVRERERGCVIRISF